MFEAKIENVKGNVLTLTGRETDFQIISITGLNPPNAQINTSSIAGFDGAKFNSSKLETRQIVIDLKLNGWGDKVEENRQILYKYFPTKEWCKFYFKSAYRNVYIEGWVEVFEDDLFNQAQIVQVSILCPQPYFKALDMIIDDISKIVGTFEFPFAFGANGAKVSDVNTDEAIPFSEVVLDKITNVYNNSESETGVIIEIDILEPVNTIEIRNTETGETFILDYEFLKDDKIIIDTNKGHKSITLVRNHVKYNIFTAMRKGSKFFQLLIGDNFFTYIVDSGEADTSVNIAFKHYTLYRGV